MSFENDFDFDFDSEFEKLFPTEELRRLYDKMAARFKTRSYMANPIVVKTISEMKSYFESEYCMENSVSKPKVTVEFNEMFNLLSLNVRCDSFTIPTKSKVKFDSLFQRCNNVCIDLLTTGQFEIGFGFFNAFIFTDENED